MYFTRFGKRIKEARENLGYSQEQFATIVGCEVSVLRFIEDDKASTGKGFIAVLWRISRELGLPLDVLLFEDTNLFDMKLREAQLQALNIIADCGITDSLTLTRRLMEELEHELQMPLAEDLSSTLYFRERGKRFEVTEDRIRDLLSKIRKTSN
jgi:transcriptional regulator with XRE-family HTH domain